MTVWTSFIKRIPTESISVTKKKMSPRTFPLRLRGGMAALFRLSGSIKSCSQKQTSWWRNGNELPLEAAQHRRYNSNIFQIPGAFNKQPTNYFDLAFCFGAVADASVGAAAGEGLTDAYRPRHLQRHSGIATKEVHIVFAWAHQRTGLAEQVTYRSVILFTKALTALTILRIRICFQNDRQVGAFKAFLCPTSIQQVIFTVIIIISC